MPVICNFMCIRSKAPQFLTVDKFKLKNTETFYVFRVPEVADVHLTLKVKLMFLPFGKCSRNFPWALLGSHTP